MTKRLPRAGILAMNTKPFDICSQMNTELKRNFTIDIFYKIWAHPSLKQEQLYAMEYSSYAALGAVSTTRVAI